MTITQKAYLFACNKHQGQKYSGRNFVYHLWQTAKLIRFLTPKDYNLIAAAYLHDTLEDTETTFEELVENFNEDIASLVQEVTKDGYNSFPHLSTQRGVMLKFADRLANISNMDDWSEEKKQKYLLEKSKFWK